MLTRHFQLAVCWVVATLLTGASASARSANVDWKFYGGASIDEQTVCFYDSKGITHGPQSHVRVWTKCLRQKDVERVDIQKEFGGAILKNTAQKVADSYVPPIAAVQTIDASQRMTIIQYEQTADIGSIAPQATIFYELNCPDRMIRELSIAIQTGGKSGFRDKPSDWKYTPPEGNGSRLLRILCRAE